MATPLNGVVDLADRFRPQSCHRTSGAHREPGAFSVRFAAKDIAALREIYEQPGFSVFGGDQSAAGPGAVLMLIRGHSIRKGARPLRALVSGIRARPVGACLRGRRRDGRSA